MAEICDVSIVVPCYHEEGHLYKNVNALVELMCHTTYSYEIILVEDCSKDNTKAIIQSLVNELSNVRAIFHERNVGRGGSFIDGVNAATGKYIGFLDIDLEVPCLFMLEVLLALDHGAQVAIVNRHYSVQLSLSFIIRHLLSVGYKALVSNYLGIPKMDTETGFKFFTRSAIMNLKDRVQDKKWFFDTEVMVYALALDYKVKQVDGLFVKNPQKTSTVNIVSDTFTHFKELVKLKKRLKNEFLLKQIKNRR